jgi:DUF4097 and DUF4098 domain-containing protein YvlB
VKILTKKILWLVLFVFCVSLAYSFETKKNLSLSAEGIQKLEIDCGAGFCYVTGDDSLRNIEVEAEIIVEGRRDREAEEYIEENVRLELRKQGSKAVLISQFDDRFRVINFRSRVINLTVKVPRNMDVSIDDGSGELRVEQIAGRVQIDDGSGEIFIRDIRGDVSVDDGSGTIEVSDVVGNLSIDDGSGTIEVNSIEKNVEVIDGSGSIYIDGVGGDVIIRDDGSGSLHIQNVKGKVKK